VNADEERALLLALIGGCMTTLDWVSTTTEGTPKEPFQEIHRRVGDQMLVVNTEIRAILRTTGRGRR
jgi:hypothetical protein